MTPALSTPVSRGLALGLLVALLLLVFMLVVEPLLNTYRDAISTTAELRTALAHAQGSGHDLAALQAEVERLQSREHSTTGFLQGTNESLAAAELQNRLKTLVGAVHGELRSTQILPVREEGKVRRITIRGQIIADIAGIQHIFYQLESGQPYLFLDNVEIRPQPMPLLRGAARDANLEVRFDLYGYMQGPA